MLVVNAALRGGEIRNKRTQRMAEHDWAGIRFTRIAEYFNSAVIVYALRGEKEKEANERI